MDEHRGRKSTRVPPSTGMSAATGQPPRGQPRYGTVRPPGGPGPAAGPPPRPHRLPWRATEEERAIVRTVRRCTRFALDDLTFALRHFLPHLNRHGVWRILRAEGLHRLADLPPLHPDERRKKGQGKFRGYDLGFIHVDIRAVSRGVSVAAMS